MKKYGEIKKLSFEKLTGIFQKATDNHYLKLYQGYVKKWVEIEVKLLSVDKTLANASFSDFRELKVEQSFTSNAIVLHEAYFDILGGTGKPEGKILEALDKDFDSFEKWFEDFKALALPTRGWAILGYDFNDGTLKNFIMDAHNLYAVCGTAPILVLDMYEHAYFSDFGTDKKAYIETFFANLNWAMINQKYERLTKV